MKKLEDYMNELDIINEPLPLREVHAIRLKIYDEIKDMMFDERSAYYAKGKDICKKYNLKIVPNAK